MYTCKHELSLYLSLVNHRQSAPSVSRGYEYSTCIKNVFHCLCFGWFEIIQTQN